ncbi:GH92 family glycosyl hydrolase [Sunxiuqinia sp. A32]|uniref:GH92 family glycosyl hydrolase n=1 Tax=Sunxiuqinia sp. A32 TaxID=3461496 RepID=UPI004045215F
MKHISLFVIVVLTMTGCAKQPEINNVDFIRPVIGAVKYTDQSDDVHGFGKTFPGPTTPFGLVQPSPVTRTRGDESGYAYNHTTIEGFCFTSMSGVGWYGDLGNFLVMPTTGEIYTNKGDDEHPEQGCRSRFTHDGEEISAGYYAVNLTDYDIRAELTTAPRAGIMRFTFPENEQSHIQIDLARRRGGTSTEQFIQVVDDYTIQGWMKCPPEGGGWGNGDGKADYTVYFYCQFSKPLEDFGVWSAEIPEDWVRKNEEVQSPEYQEVISKAKLLPQENEMQGKHLGFYANYNTKDGEQILLKSGISFVSIEGAKENLEHDIADWNFEQVLADARGLWRDAIDRVKVTGGTEADKIKFYTSLYHTMIDPRASSDVNGQYIGADNQVHVTDDFTYRTIFSGWDVFRSQFPLQTIINPSLVNDEVNSLIQLAELSGNNYYPRWELLNAFSGCMIGNPAVSVVVDAYEKGIRNYDIEKAFQFAKNSVDKFGNQPLGYTPNSLSHTLEYAYTDWCVGRFAESLNKDDLAEEYYNRSTDYKNIWDKDVNWFRAKDADGNWIPWQGKTVHGQGCVESNPYQQGWFVPHDMDGLMKLLGGKENFKSELLNFFSNTPDDFLWNDYYNHANEPVHHIPFLFNEVGLPHETQEWTRKICDKAYGTDAFGLCGNEDVGQMSAFYVLAAIGIHPVCPGDNKYEITSPVFNSVDIQLDPDYYSGKTFSVIAHNNSPENVYIKSIKLNGKPLNRFWILHDEIVNGGVLEMEMTSSIEN